jgi:hypothetical protein
MEERILRAWTPLRLRPWANFSCAHRFLRGAIVFAALFEASPRAARSKARASKSGTFAG